MFRVCLGFRVRLGFRVGLGFRVCLGVVCVGVVWALVFLGASWFWLPFYGLDLAFV